jgi:acyl dehydratase
MPIDLERALGQSLPPAVSSWDQDDVILYHLGVGAGNPPTERGELAYTYEADLKVLPSFATIAPFPMMFNLAGVPGLEFNPALLLHGEQEITLFRPIPSSSEATHRGRVAEIWDKGKAALVVVEVASSDQQGTQLFVNRFSLFLRGEGGFGGEPGPSAVAEAPARPPDHVISSPTLPQQALLYRLSGDKNPLHADPAFAALGGFDRPILHGLCSYGVVCKAVVDHALGGDVTGVIGYRARFSGVVFPGETIVTSIWDEGGGRLLVSASTRERELPVITNGVVTLGS